MAILHMLGTLGTLGLVHLFIRLFFGFMILCFIGRMILSWLSMVIPSLNPGNPFVRFFNNITDPVYDPLYRRIPGSSIGGGFDIRVAIAFIFAWWGLSVIGVVLSSAIPAGW